MFNVALNPRTAPHTTHHATARVPATRHPIGIKAAGDRVYSICLFLLFPLKRDMQHFSYDSEHQERWYITGCRHHILTPFVFPRTLLDYTRSTSWAKQKQNKQFYVIFAVMNHWYNIQRHTGNYP